MQKLKLIRIVLLRLSEITQQDEPKLMHNKASQRDQKPPLRPGLSAPAGGVMHPEISQLSNKNTDYEKLVAEIHQGMLKYEGFENIRAEHNVTLTGKSGATHQIDVFWEFKAAGTIYRTCIECKNYSSAVKKSHVAAFAEILKDIGNANGIIATTLSFQKGARLLAEHNNIRLVIVNPLLKEIHITMNPIATNFENFRINFNEKSIKEALIRNNLEKFSMNLNLTGNQPLQDKNGENITTIDRVLNKHAKKEGSNLIEGLNFYLFIEDIGPVLIDSLHVDVSHADLSPMKSIIKSPHSANTVIEDIVNNNIHYLHDDGSVNQKINA